MKHCAALFLLLVLLLGGCSNALRWTPDYHVVRSGETLYSIAMRYDLDARDLASWNSLGDGSYIREGQKLRLRAPSGVRSKSPGATNSPRTAVSPSKTAPVLPAPGWRWPTEGNVSYRYGASAKTSSGIRISGEEGQPVRSSAAGEVVYAGTGLKSYGQLLIIKHNDTWLTAYGFNDRLYVAEGERVSSGQKIASMGRDSAGKPVLHFEIRRNGQPQNPELYLPRR